MTELSVDAIECGPQLDAAAFLDEIRRPRSVSHVLVHAVDVHVGADAIAAMLGASSSPMAATISPLPVPAASRRAVAIVATDPRLPPAPTVALGCPAACLISRDALESVSSDARVGSSDWQSAFWRLNQRLSRAGWRHVAAPGVVLSWPHEPGLVDDMDGAWSASMMTHQNGPANEGLATHVLWAETRLRPLRIVVDGACLTDAPHNGSQAVVMNVSTALARSHPDATVVLAVPRPFVAHIDGVTGGSGVEVVPRERGVSGFDAVYRPYQLLDPAELTWLAEAGERLVVGQLDMIAFSNASYHPSAALFHAVRNLQRHTMRFADAVTFISEFGMHAALAECPDLDPARCFVVSCGVETSGSTERSSQPAPPAAAGLAERPFILCMAATFWHKNRQHAIAVFAELCRRHAYDGQLVIAGPEPYYGRSTDDELALIASLAPDVADRVLHLGQVDEGTKWWLLQAADLVLYPSVVEGFGLVPFEAAAVGTPSLSHGGSAVREILGEGPAVVATWSLDDWADVAAGIIRCPDHAAEVLSFVQHAAAEHTWDAAADRTWAAIEATLARPHAQRHAEEGHIVSRVGGPTPTLARGAHLAHFGNRVVGYVKRRLRG